VAKQSRIDVFISSTSIDLPEYRAAVRDAILSLGMFPSGMEHWPVSGENPVDLCRKMVGDAELYVGVFAKRYGWMPDGFRSITEMEYDWAGDVKRNGSPMPRLCFVMKDDFPFPDSEESDDAKQGLARFKARVKKEAVGFFTTPTDLKAQVLAALAPFAPRPLTPAERLRRNLQLVLPILFLLVLVVLGTVYILTTREPEFPPNSPFNIAIANFVADPSAGLSQADAERLSEQFYSNLKVAVDVINPDLTKVAGTMGIWEPRLIGTVRGATAAERDENAEALVKRLKETKNAEVHILVYGIITKQEDGQVAVIPEFYNFHPSPELNEVRGRFAIATALATPNESLMSTLSVQLLVRAELLSLITQGLSLMTAGVYDRAYNAYEQALDVGGPDMSGKELLHILMGNAATFNYNNQVALGTAKDLATKLPVLLDQAEASYNNAVALNTAYSRAYAGLGGVAYLRVVRGVADKQDWAALDEAALAAVEAAFDKGLVAADIPESADIPTKVKFGKAQVAMLRYLRDSRRSLQTEAQAAWQQADQGFAAVIADYGDGTNPRVKEFAAQANGYRALLRREQGDFSGAVSFYELAADLTDLPARKQLFIRSIAQITADERRAARDIDGALTAYDELLALKMPPSEKGAIYFQKCKMLSEADRAAESLACFEEAVKLDLTAAPVVAASLWVELGNKYYDGGRLAECITAYEKAIALDPQGQGHLTRLIDETKAEFAAITPTPTP
jgi:tetratricopeptide (TPR) repeat protein